MAVEVPQWEKESCEEIVGVTDKFEPVQASNAALCDRFQSCVPSRWRIDSVSLVDLGVISNEMGVVEVRR